MRDLKIVFMGTPDFAVGILQKLIDAKLQIVGVVTAPDKPAGRGRKLRSSAVKEFSINHQLKILQPVRLKDPEFLAELEALNADLFVVVAFRMLPTQVWQMPAKGTFNLHASLLPQYRGAAPINWAIINGENKTGVTTFFIDEKIDTGAMILQQEIDIDPDETAGTLHDKLMHLGGQVVLDTLEQIAKDKVETKIQPETDKLMEAPKLRPGNTRIDWSTDSESIDFFVRGLNPFPGAWTNLKNEDEELKIKIFSGQPKIEKHDHEPGAIISDKKQLLIATKNGYFEIDELQFPGKRKMVAKSLLNGYDFQKDAKMA